jgi:hypothetical protein
MQYANAICKCNIFNIQKAKSKKQNAKSKKQNAKSKMQNVKSKNKK